MKHRGWAVLAASVACMGVAMAVWHDAPPRLARVAGGSAISPPAGPAVSHGITPRPAIAVVDRTAVRAGMLSAAVGPVRPLLVLAGTEPPRKDGVFTLYPVRIDERQAIDAMSGGRLSIPTPDGSSIDLTFEHAVD